MKGPVQAGMKHPRPKPGKNGPDGKGGGTKHMAAKLPKPKRTGMK